MKSSCTYQGDLKGSIDCDCGAKLGDPFYTCEHPEHEYATRTVRPVRSANILGGERVLVKSVQNCLRCPHYLEK